MPQKTLLASTSGKNQQLRQPLCDIKAWGPMSSQAGGVALPWSKAWQLWGARHSSRLRPEQGGSLATPMSALASRKATTQWPGQQKSSAYSAQAVALLPPQRENSTSTTHAPPRPLPHQEPGSGLATFTPRKSEGTDTSDAASGRYCVFWWRFTEAGRHGVNIFGSQSGTMSQLLGNPGAAFILWARESCWRSSKVNWSDPRFIRERCIGGGRVLTCSEKNNLDGKVSGNDEKWGTDERGGGMGGRLRGIK